jgi:DNA repair protein RecO (recombination protein O)
MYYKTPGIFLKQIKYSDTSAVLRIYTGEFGLQSYMAKGLHQKKSKLRPALFQPLSLLDLIVSHKEKASLQHIKEAKPARIFNSSANILKNTVILFLNELLFKSLQEEESNPQLFNFIYNSLEWMDEQKDLSPLYHLKFSVELSKYLGFYPEGKLMPSKTAFDLAGGTFCPDPGMFAEEFITGEPAALFSRLIETDRELLKEIKVSGNVRRELLQKILLYYQVHIPSAKDFKSHKVLHEILK